MFSSIVDLHDAPPAWWETDCVKYAWVEASSPIFPEINLIINRGGLSIQVQLHTSEIAINIADGKSRDTIDRSQVHDAAHVEAAGGLRGTAKSSYRTKKIKGPLDCAEPEWIITQVIAEDDPTISMRAEVSRGRG